MTLARCDLGKFLERLLGLELRAWRGETPPGLVFWLYGVFASTVLLILHARAFELRQWMLLQVLVLLSAAYTVWILVAIWRCAQNAGSSWGGLARWLTFAWGLNAALVLFFLEFDLLMRHVG